MRLPLYIMLETDNVDRARVVKVLENIIIPDFVKILIAKANQGITLESKDINAIKEVAGPFTLRVVSASEAIAQK